MTPHVTCICLTADRQKMTDRAVQSFLAQTYPNKSLLVFDNGKIPWDQSHIHWPRDHADVIHTECRSDIKISIGELRNRAISYASQLDEMYVSSTVSAKIAKPDIITHWDSDDWSHPLRLAWQVMALKSAEGVDAAGYRSMLFWVRAPGGNGAEAGPPAPGDESRQAWLYESEKPRYALGTSLIYWRSVWQNHKFREDVKFGEDNEWIKGLNLLSETGFFKNEPAMIAEHHGGNLTDHSQVIGNSPNWKRMPEWDKAVAERMRL